MKLVFESRKGKLRYSSPVLPRNDLRVYCDDLDGLALEAQTRGRTPVYPAHAGLVISDKLLHFSKL